MTRRALVKASLGLGLCAAIAPALRFAAASGAADLERAAVAGFCWGGRQAWL